MFSVVSVGHFVCQRGPGPCTGPQPRPAATFLVQGPGPQPLCIRARAPCPLRDMFKLVEVRPHCTALPPARQTCSTWTTSLHRPTTHPPRHIQTFLLCRKSRGWHQTEIPPCLEDD